MNLWERLRVVHRAWRYRLRTEPLELAFVLSHLQPGQTALDIGAHKGVFAYWMHRCVGPTGRVVAFEPQPGLAAYIERMKRAFRLDRLTVVQAALSSNAGRKNLFLPREFPGEATLETIRSRNLGPGAGLEIEVDSVTLDDYLERLSARPVHFLKCDVEGHELEVFRGGQRMLREDRPALLFECQDFRHPGGHTRRVFDYLRRLGYEGRFLTEDGQAPVDAFRPEVHQALGRRPLDNFIFLPKPARLRRTA
jgi:FkbM family methyltransferase